MILFKLLFGKKIKFSKEVRDIAIETIVEAMPIPKYTLKQQEEALSKLLRKYIDSGKIQSDYQKWSKMR